MRAGGFDIGATVAPKPTPPVATGPTIYKILNNTEEEHGDFVALDKLPTCTAAMPVSVTVAELFSLREFRLGSRGPVALWEKAVQFQFGGFRLC